MSEANQRGVEERAMERRFLRRRVLVTGGAGFIGSVLTRALLSEGAQVTVLDDFFTGRRSALPIHDDLHVVEGCVTDRDLVRSLVDRCEFVFHLAARNIIVSIDDPEEDFQVNAGGTLNLLRAVRDSGNQQRVVYASSASVYGNPAHLPINEDSGVTCLSPYAASKRTGELYSRVFFEMWETKVATVRYSNVYGVGQTPENPYCGVIGKFLTLANRGAPLPVHGDGLQTRDYTYVDDAVEVTLLAALSPRAEGEVFNVGTGVETTVLQLVDAIGGLFQDGLRVEYVNRRDIDNVRRRVMNIEKTRSRLRWIPKVRLQEGLRTTMLWLQEQQSGPSDLGE